MAHQIREITGRHGLTPDTAIGAVEIITEQGEVRRGFRVGGTGPIFASYPAASRYADAKRAKDARIGRRLIEAKQAAARVLAAASVKANATRRGVAVAGGTARERRTFGAGLGV